MVSVPQQRRKLRSIASKFSVFTGVLLLWVVGVMLWWDIRRHMFDWAMGASLLVAVAGVAAAISRFTIRVLARPLMLLERGITAVRQGRLEPLQVSKTGDEIQSLGESFNRMIAALAASQEEIRQHQELLEERIRERTGQLKEAMQSALTASKAKSEFLANMSHELRTPMNGLLGMLDLVLDSSLSEDQRDQVETAQRCAYSLLGLLNDILDLSKIEAGKMVLEDIAFDLLTVLQDCVKSQAAKAAQKGIELELIAGSTKSLGVVGDPLRLRQIVSNLLSNAIKFTEQGSVVVTLRSQPEGANRVRVEIEVADTGAGIPADKVPLIFDKFTQADTSITRKYGGTGLGLAITKRLVEMHRGNIQVESEVGKGSRFKATLFFGSAPLPATEQAPEAPASEEKSQRSVRLLIVEDNVVNQKVVLAMLRKLNYHIDVANDGREAILLLNEARDPYDVVLMDVQMPVLDGLEATRLLRRDPRFEKLPIIAMTAHAMNGDRERCLNAGMNAYVSKPVQPKLLISTIAGFLEPAATAQPVPTP